VRPPAKSQAERLLSLVVLWCAIQALTNGVVVHHIHTSYTDCVERINNCSFADTLSRKIEYEAFFWGQCIQPVGSALLFGLLVKHSSSEGTHAGKAIGLGVLMIVVAGVCALLIVNFYPHPRGYPPSPGAAGLLIFFLYALPILQLASAILGGFFCAVLDWTKFPPPPRPHTLA
jgi:hypothetical protein